MPKDNRFPNLFASLGRINTIRLSAVEYEGKIQFQPDFGSRNNQVVTFYLFYDELEPGVYDVVLRNSAYSHKEDKRGYKIRQVVVDKATKIGIIHSAESFE
jgi:hypothetical protein